MIWDRVPKSRYCGFAKMELGVYDAVAHFNLGKVTIVNVFNTLNIEPGLFARKMCELLNKKRKIFCWV